MSGGSVDGGDTASEHRGGAGWLRREAIEDFGFGTGGRAISVVKEEVRCDGAVMEEEEAEAERGGDACGR